MKLETSGDTLKISAVKQLGAANAGAFRDWARKALTEGFKNIEVDLSETSFVDSCGLGALVALHKTACSRGGVLRLLKPPPPVQQILDLTRLSRIFEVVHS
jgi:anti-sigma B factor antagonist